MGLAWQRDEIGIMKLSPLTGLRGDGSNQRFHVLWGSSVQEKTRKKEDLGFLKVLGATPESAPENVVAFSQALPA